MAGKTLPVPKVRYVPPEKPADEKITEVYEILFKKIMAEIAFANKKGAL